MSWRQNHRHVVGWENALSRRVTRTIKLYAMHARTPDGPIDYASYFARLAEVEPQDTSTGVTNELVFSLDRIRTVAGRFQARVIVSSPDEAPTFFDYRTGEVEKGETPAGKWLAKVARLTIDPSPEARLLALESTRSGVSTVLLERYFSRLARKLEWAPSLTFDLNPVPAPSLINEIKGLERIREAAVVASRPNFDWQDTSDNLSELAAQSGGHVAEAVVRAGRNETLSRQRGIVSIILDSLRQRTPHLKDFRIIGRPVGSRQEITLSSERHQRRAFIEIDPQADVTNHDEAFFDASATFVDEAKEDIEHFRAEE